MNENFLAWLDALESGKYQQAQKRLGAFLTDDHTESAPIGRCCLGVACVQYAEKYDDLRREIGMGNNSDKPGEVFAWDSPYGEITEDIYPPEKVWKWIGLKDREGKIDLSIVPADDPLRVPAVIHGSLARMNDSGDLSFQDIAAFCRRNPEAVLA